MLYRGGVSSLFLFAFKVFVETEHKGFAAFAGLSGGARDWCSLLWWLCRALRPEDDRLFHAHIRTEARRSREKDVVEGDLDLGGRDVDFEWPASRV